MLDKLITLLDQPSTWAGFSGLALSLGLTEPQWTAISAAGAAIFGMIAVFKNEKARP